MVILFFMFSLAVAHKTNAPRDGRVVPAPLGRRPPRAEIDTPNNLGRAPGRLTQRNENGVHKPKRLCVRTTAWFKNSQVAVTSKPFSSPQTYSYLQITKLANQQIQPK